MSAKDRLRLAKRKQVLDLALHDEHERTHSPTAIMRKLQLDHDPTTGQEPPTEPATGSNGENHARAAPPPVEPLQARRRRPSGRKGRKV